MSVTREEYLRRRREFYQANKDRLREAARKRAAERRKEAPEAVRLALAAWRDRNRPRAKKWAREYHRERLKDPRRLAEKRLHGILASAVRTGGSSPLAQGAEFLRWLRPEAIEVLGADVQIDHLEPIASFDLGQPEQKKLANSDDNVWWLPRVANRLKGRRPATMNELRIHSELKQLFLLWKSNNTTPYHGDTTRTPLPACSPLRPARISNKKIAILKRLKQELFNTRLLRRETCRS